MSKTIEEIKEEYFKEIGFKSLDDAVMEISIGMSKIGSASVLENHFTKIAQRYAQSQTQELIELLKAVSLSAAFENAKEQFGSSSPNHWTNKVESVILKYKKP